MEQIEVSRKIQDYVEELELRKKTLENFVKSKKIHKALLALNKKVETETIKAKFDEKVPVTLIGNIVKGKCADEYADYEQAGMEYRAAVKLIEATESQMNAYQSIFRWQSEI